MQPDRRWTPADRDAAADPTPAEIEAAAAILRIQVSTECWCIEWPADVAQPPTPTPCDDCERRSAALARSVLTAVLPDHDAQVRVPLLSLIADLTDDGPCRYDHNGYCQGHSLDPKPCPHERAKRVLARTHATTTTREDR